MSNMNIPDAVLLRIMKLPFENNRNKIEPWTNFEKLSDEFKKFYMGFANDLIIEYEAWKKEQGK
jgi:hypothetical protein